PLTVYKSTRVPQGRDWLRAPLGGKDVTVKGTLTFYQVHVPGGPLQGSYVVARIQGTTRTIESAWTQNVNVLGEANLGPVHSSAVTLLHLQHPTIPLLDLKLSVEFLPLVEGWVRKTVSSDYDLRQ